MTKATFKRMAQTEQAESAERLCEYLSAVMDGEADDLTLRRLAQESATYPELADKWERYHLARDLIHGRGIPVSSGFSERVATAVDAETVPQAPSVTRSGLTQQLTAARQQQGDDLEVRIRGSRVAPYQFFEPIMLACTESGIWNVTFAVYREEVR